MWATALSVAFKNEVITMKYVYILLLVLSTSLFSTSFAMASPGDDGCVGNCTPPSGGVGEQSQGQLQGQAQGQLQGQAQGQAQKTVVSVGNKNSNSNSNANVNSNRNDNSNTNANLNANVNANKNNNSSSAVSEGSNATAQSGDSGASADASIDITTGGTQVNTANNYPKDSAHSAAGVFPQSCQEGASGQSYSGGASSVFESAMCQSLKMAEVHQKYWVMYTEMGDVNQAAMHKKLMDENIAKASAAAESMYYPKQVGTFFLSILPVGLLFLVI